MKWLSSFQAKCSSCMCTFSLLLSTKVRMQNAHCSTALLTLLEPVGSSKVPCLFPPSIINGSCCIRVELWSCSAGLESIFLLVAKRTPQVSKASCRICFRLLTPVAFTGPLIATTSPFWSFICRWSIAWRSIWLFWIDALWILMRS